MGHVGFQGELFHLKTRREKKQGRIVHRSGKENKIIYKINKGEKGLINI